MPTDRLFLDYILHDQMRSLEGINARAMFGGWGIYRHGVIFAIVVDDCLFFKVGPENRPDYEKSGSRPFTYRRGKKKAIAMSYWECPPEVLEDPGRLSIWASKAVQAGKRAKR